MIAKTLFLMKEKHRIGVRDLRDHVPGPGDSAEARAFGRWIRAAALAIFSARLAVFKGDGLWD